MNEYRVHDGCVELRILHPSLPRAGQNCPWRPLNADEILLHVSLDTALAQWLFQRFRSLAR